MAIAVSGVGVVLGGVRVKEEEEEGRAGLKPKVERCGFCMKSSQHHKDHINGALINILGQTDTHDAVLSEKNAISKRKIKSKR